MSKIALFQTIQFIVISQFSYIWLIDRTLSGANIPVLEWTWERWKWRGTPHSPKLKHYRSLNIFSVISRIHFCVISRILVGRVIPLCRDALSVFCSPSQLAIQDNRWGSLTNLQRCSQCCDTMWPLCWVCVCVRAPVKRSLCLFWRETQTKGLSSRSPARPEVDVERKGPEKTGG